MPFRDSHEAFGGTWLIHRYPGARSDSDLFTFGYLTFSSLPQRDARSTGVDLASAMQQMREALPTDAIVTNGAGNYAVWLHRFFQYRAHRTELAPTCGAMGYGLPAAIAAALRRCGTPTARWLR